MDLLRVGFIGSVDDGKSTLIGRLFHDTDSILDDQRADLTSLAQFTDGLRAERELGITIDVAYRFFATKTRKYIVVDCPGHFEFTRNMITGCSNVDAVVVLIDARNGMTEQTKRHLAIAAMLKIEHFIVCINKMDLVHHDPNVFETIAESVRRAALKIGIRNLEILPISAASGENVVVKSELLSWATPRTLLEALESLELEERKLTKNFRFPVQRVILTNTPEAGSFLGYAGKIASGRVKVGDLLLVGASKSTARVKGIHTFDHPILEEASAPLSVVLTLEHNHAISRGDLLIGGGEPPLPTQVLTLQICWLNLTPLDIKATYLMKIGHQYIHFNFTAIDHRLEIDSLEAIVSTEKKLETVGLNTLARVRLRTSVPVVGDSYEQNRTTGSLIIIDPITNQTVAAGMILEDHS